MIYTKDELEKSEAVAYVLSRELAETLYKGTRNVELKKKLDKISKTIIITNSLKVELFSQLKAIKISRKGVGGRPRIPDPDNPDNLTGDALKKYKNRKWQRESRVRRGITINP